MNFLETNQNVFPTREESFSTNSGRQFQRVSRTKAETEELKRICYERVKTSGERPVDVCRDLGVSKTFLYSSLKEQEIDEEEELNKLRTEFYSVKRKLNVIQIRMGELLEGIFERCKNLGYPTVEFDDYKSYIEYDEPEIKHTTNENDKDTHISPKKKGRKKKSDN